MQFSQKIGHGLGVATNQTGLGGWAWTAQVLDASGDEIASDRDRLYEWRRKSLAGPGTAREEGAAQ